MAATEEGGEDVRVERDGAVATVVLNRPSAMNALTRGSRRLLASRLRELGRDPAVRAVVLTGEGRAFCAGQDLKEEGALDAVDDTIRDTYAPVVQALVELPRPVVAAINGPAAGAGLAFALACDLRLMAADAVLSTAFTSIGLVPDSGATWFLPRTVGYARAFELSATARRVDADEALSLGLVQHVVPPARLRQEAASLAADLASRPPLALAWTKRLLRRAETSTLAEALELEAQLQAQAVATADHEEGVRAFLERRSPRFEGR